MMLFGDVDDLWGSFGRLKLFKLFRFFFVATSGEADV